MRLLKGIVVDIKDNLATIQMENGKVFTAIPTPTMTVKCRVLISWDFTHNKPHKIHTKQDCARITSDRNKSESETFSIPEERIIEMPNVDMSMFDFDMTRFSRYPTDDENDDGGDIVDIPNNY